MSAKTATPSFVYGRPVRPGEFLNREAELRTVFNRLRNCESTAVVGEPHIGKSSLLLQLADEATQQAHLGDDAQRLLVSWLDLHSIPSDYNPTIFWGELLEPLQDRPGHTTVTQRLEAAAQAGYTRRPLERLFNYLGKQGRRLVVLLDEFERLLDHPNFQNFHFFATMRSLASYSGGFFFVTSSRSSVAELNKRGNDLPGSGGSPLFNIQCEVRLRPFDEQTVGLLLSRAGDALSSDDQRFIRRVAGCHPYLLQAMAATLVGTTGDDRQARAAETFYKRISFHFDDLWRTLDDRTRTAAVILSLVELGGRALGQDFAYGEIEKVDSFGPELQKMAERGLAERVGEGWQFDWEHLLIWQRERWTIGAQAFAWWVRDVAIAGARRVPGYEEWLEKKRYRLLLTQEQWDGLVGAVRKAPNWAVRGVAGLAQALLEELRRK